MCSIQYCFMVTPLHLNLICSTDIFWQLIYFKIEIKIQALDANVKIPYYLWVSNDLPELRKLCILALSKRWTHFFRNIFLLLSLCQFICILKGVFRLSFRRAFLFLQVIGSSSFHVLMYCIQFNCMFLLQHECIVFVLISRHQY